MSSAFQSSTADTISTSCSTPLITSKHHGDEHQDQPTTCDLSVLDQSNPCSQGSGDPNLHTYFAIASMMNPISLRLRDLSPVTSRPAELLDYELGFFGGMGFAEAIPKKGCSFHGVVHTFTEKDMQHLDHLEGHLYIRTPATARLYDTTLISVTVYCRTPGASHEPTTAQPQERYLDIMIEGAQHFGVKEEYVRMLQNIDREPRLSPDQFTSFGPAPLFRMHHDEVMKNDGNDGRPFYITVNGKVIEVMDPTMEKTGMFRKMRAKYNSPAVEEWFLKICYDPYYGVPECARECTKEMSAYVEHFCYRRFLGDGRVVGCIHQEYKDDSPTRTR